MTTTVQTRATLPYIEQEPEREGLTPAVMEAIRSGNPDVVGKIMDYQERWERNQARKAFEEAFAAAMAEMPTIFKNKTVSYGAGKTSYKHADLAEIVRSVRPVLSKHGLSHRFRVKTEPEKVTVTCVIGHRTGYFEENTMSAAPDNSGSKNAIQAQGSAETYLSRYTLMASLGLAASDDDDGRGFGVITDEQATEIMGLITDTNSNAVKLLDIVKAPSVADMNVEQYTKAKTLLLQKKGERK
jgi:hypothetical protein